MKKGANVKPTHKAVKTYYAALAAYADQSTEHEGAVRSAIQNLLADVGRKVGWTLIPEPSLDAGGQSIRPDGTFRDEFTIESGSPLHRQPQDHVMTPEVTRIRFAGWNGP